MTRPLLLCLALCGTARAQSVPYCTSGIATYVGGDQPWACLPSIPASEISVLRLDPEIRVQLDRIEAMLKAICHRGPDDCPKDTTP
jgi:hypothetical protein